MTKDYVERYIRELSVINKVEMYESNGERVFPIHLKTPEGTMALENAYVFYLIKEPHRYGVQIFIDANMTYGAFYRIFHTAIMNFKLELMAANKEHNSTGDGSAEK